MAIPQEWSTLKLAEFLAAVSSFTTESAAARGAVERVADSLDAEVAAIVSRGTVVAAIGYPEAEVPAAELDSVAREAHLELTVPGVGLCSAAVVPLEHPPDASLVVARSGPEALGERASEASALSRDEAGLLQGMARVTSMTLRMLRLLDEERAMRTESQRQVAENARLLARLTEQQQQLARLAEEQAALRRVATRVAQGVPPSALFTSVAEEIARISHVASGFVIRFEPDATATVVANCGTAGIPMPVNSNWSLDGDSVTARVFRTGRPARIDDYSHVSGPIADVMPGPDYSAVGAPIVIDGRLWGVAVATSRRPGARATDAEEPATRLGALPADAEERIANFADLIATAISNADAREKLTASRARVVAAADDARRRLERNLHDGIQQGLISLALALRSAETMMPPEPLELHTEISQIVDGLTGVLDDLREMARGIHPAILSEGGIGYALKGLARRSAVPVVLSVSMDRRLPERVEVAAYYVVSEALTNAAKHASASVVYVDADTTGGFLRLSIRDDGVGGADLGQGSGLIGLVDRVEALGGQIEIVSPPRKGTALLVTLPIDVH